MTTYKNTSGDYEITCAGGTGNVVINGNVDASNWSTAGTATIGGLTLSGNTIVSSGATLTIDPNGSGNTDGVVVIAGNLQVTGNVTYINSDTVTINDLFVNIANNAVSASAADGGGIGIGPVGSEYATLTYNSTSNTWAISNGANITGNISATGNITSDYFIGNGSLLTNVVASSVDANNLTGTTLFGNVVNSSLTSVGTLASLSVSGNVTSDYFIGNGSLLTDITFANYTVVTTAAIVTPRTGQTIFVSDGDSGAPCLAVYDGASWKRVALGNTIST
jgi:predicted acyltransferase (DUF342 family)